MNVVDFTLEYDRGRNVVLITLGRFVTQASAMAACAAVRAFIAAQDVGATIADLSMIEEIDVPPNFVWFLAERTPAVPANKPCVLVAPRDATYGMSRMFQMLRDGMGEHCEVVRTLDEAYTKVLAVQ